MLDLILKSLYFFLPAYFANMAPIFFRKIPWGGAPIHTKLFGQNKTWRGIVAAVFLGIVVFGIQKGVHKAGFQPFALIDYADFSLWLGFWMSLGAILGDLAKSYYKRKEHISPGQKWFPFDQLDFVIGGVVGSWMVYVPPMQVVVVLLILSPVLHIVVNHLAYWLGVRKEKW